MKIYFAHDLVNNQLEVFKKLQVKRRLLSLFYIQKNMNEFKKLIKENNYEDT